MISPRLVLKRSVFTLPYSVLTATLFVGCGIKNYDPGTTTGLIIVDSPEVFTRERIVNDRYKQVEWLNSQLDRKDLQPGFQGLAETKSVTGIGTDVTVDILRSAQMAKLLASQGQGAGTQPQGSPVQTNDPLQSTLTDLADKNKQSLFAAPGSIATTQATASLIDNFRDLLAYREEVRTEIIETELDDRHDLDGQTLYRFKFDATVIPEHDTGAWAIVEVKFDEKTPCIKPEVEFESLEKRVSAVDSYLKCLDEEKQNYGALYENWRQQLERQLQEIFASMVVLYNMEALRLEQLEQLIRFAEEKLDPEDNQDTFSTDDRPGDMLVVPHQGVPRSRPQTEKQTDIQHKPIWYQRFIRLIQKLHDRKYRSSYKTADYKETLNLVFRQYLTKVYSQEYEFANYFVFNAGRVGITLTATDDGLDRFSHDLRNKNDSARIYSYAVTPKESVQRISEVGSRREVAKLLLALHATTGTADLKNVLSFIKQSEGLFNSIRRQPLVVGFGNAKDFNSGRSNDQVGWMIGPKFQLAEDGSHAVFRHTPIQNSLSATVSLPAWWRGLSVKTRTCWISSKDNTCKGTPFKEEQISLPGDSRILDRVLNKSFVRKPVVYGLDEEKQYTFVVEQPASLLVRGSNLWRATVVTVGPWKSSGIVILPNMEGIIATFDTNKWRETESSVPILVWTSEGMALAGNAVVRPARKDDSVLKTYTYRQTRYIKDSELALLSATDALLPNNAGVRIGIRRHVEKGPVPKWEFSTDTTVRQGKISSIIKAPCNGCVDGERLDIAIGFTPNPSAEENIIPLSQYPVFYVTEEQSKAHLVSGVGQSPGNIALATISPNTTIGIRFPANASQAYLDFEPTSAVPIAKGVASILFERKDCTIPAGSTQQTCMYRVIATGPSPNPKTFTLSFGEGEKPTIPETLTVP
jgi:hypothetical protein